MKSQRMCRGRQPARCFTHDQPTHTRINHTQKHANQKITILTSMAAFISYFQPCGASSLACANTWAGQNAHRD